MKRLTLLLLALAGLPAMATTLYVSPSGADTNDGVPVGNPTSLSSALKQLRPGVTLVLRGGRYLLSARLDLKQTGAPDRLITLQAFPGEVPVLDGSALDREKAGQVVRISGNYYALRGIEIVNAPIQGVLVQGSHNLFEACVAHHNAGTGFGVTLSHGETGNNDGEKAAYNRFINCDSYLNFDWYKTKAGKKRPGTDADGFACSLSSGKGNSFSGCRSWSNSDDGWDFFETGFGVVVENCWTWHNGVWTDFREEYKSKAGEDLTPELFSGDGNGFKMGGNHSTGGTGCTKSSTGTNVLRNSISFQNQGKGIDQNNHQDGVCVENCLSFDNGTNIRFWKKPNDGRRFVFRNNAIFGRGTKESGITIPCTAENNTWQGGIDASESDFTSLRPEDAGQPRNGDGSLPSGFGRLRPQSKLIDAGVKTERIIDPGIDLAPIGYEGVAPDLAPIEFMPVDAAAMPAWRAPVQPTQATTP